MELTLAEEIRALLEMREKYPNSNRTIATLLEAFPALAARMLAVIEERDDLRNRWVLTNRQAMEELTDTQDSALKKQAARIAELGKSVQVSAKICRQRETMIDDLNAIIEKVPGFAEATARIAELKEDAVRWETRYRGAMDELAAAQKERDRLRFEAECLQVTVR